MSASMLKCPSKLCHAPFNVIYRGVTAGLTFEVRPLQITGVCSIVLLSSLQVAFSVYAGAVQLVLFAVTKSSTVQDITVALVDAHLFKRRPCLQGLFSCVEMTAFASVCCKFSTLRVWKVLKVQHWRTESNPMPIQLNLVNAIKRNKSCCIACCQDWAHLY